MNLYIYCAGAFGKELMDVARRNNKISSYWTKILFVDDLLNEKTKYGSDVLTFEEVCHLGISGKFIIAHGEPAARKNIAKKLTQQGFSLGKLIDYSTIVSESAKLKEGVVITPFCSISSDTTLDTNSCINTMSIVGHDAKVGKNSVISSMVNLGGGVIVGDDSYIGMGALIKEGVTIGSNSIVGFGSVVYSDIPNDVIALGNPARVVRPNVNQKIFK